MLWFTLSITAALCSAANDAISKHFFSDLTAYEMGLIRLLYAFPYLIMGFFVIPRPEIDGIFLVSIAVALPLELIAFLSYMRAIKVSPLSLTIPFLAFTPAFIMLTGYFLLGEVLNPFGIVGIILIITGSYVLNLSGIRHEWLAPFKSIFREQGSWLMLITSFIFSITSTIGKLAIEHSSPQFFAVTYFSVFSLFVFFLFPFIKGASFKNLVKRPYPGIINGLVTALMIFSHTLAVSLVQVAYMISVKRTSLLFAVVLGAVFFKEKKIKERLSGAFIMIVGIFMIGLLG